MQRVGRNFELRVQLGDERRLCLLECERVLDLECGREERVEVGVDTLVDSVQFTANLVLMTKKGVWGAGWDERNQQNMYTAHLSTVDKAVQDTLGEAVDSIDKTLATQKALLNDHVLPSAY